MNLLSSTQVYQISGLDWCFKSKPWHQSWLCDPPAWLWHPTLLIKTDTKYIRAAWEGVDTFFYTAPTGDFFKIPFQWVKNITLNWSDKEFKQSLCFVFMCLCSLFRHRLITALVRLDTHDKLIALFSSSQPRLLVRHTILMLAPMTSHTGGGKQLNYKAGAGVPVTSCCFMIICCCLGSVWSTVQTSSQMFLLL